MKIAFFSAHSYDIESLKGVAQQVGVAPQHELAYVSPLASRFVN